MRSRRSFIGESTARLREGDLRGTGDVWRHEGLKTGVERVLHASANSAAGRFVLGRVAGSMPDDRRLRTRLGSLELAGPTGLAPGWDKTGNTIRAWEALGARHHTTGGITLRPQRGNAMPRLRTFDQRVGDHGKRVSLNSYGFPSLGIHTVARNMARQRELGVTIPVIAQVVPNADMYAPEKRDLIARELAEAIGVLIRIAEPDAINLGLSSPNTSGMRDAQSDYQFMRTVASRAIDAVTRHTNRDIPVVYKGDGDGGKDRLDLYCQLAKEAGVALELINTTAKPDIKGKYGAAELPGGLAGADPDYQELALHSVAYVYHETYGDVPIIGVGGVDSPEQELKMIEAGASLVGVNTAVRSLGLQTFPTLEAGLLDILSPEQSIADVIGTAASNPWA